ncbi:MAG: hypothetical protein EOP11_10915 [Proteobacteria bacterium]|nr:MAG: hypothetical protein EOP11_10915 [Pseudomonadota bacterium]
MKNIYLAASAFALVLSSASAFAASQGAEGASLASITAGRLACYSQNLEGRQFRAIGRDAIDTQARALNQCYARSFGLLKGTCIPTGCR